MISRLNSMKLYTLVCLGVGLLGFTRPGLTTELQRGFSNSSFRGTYASMGIGRGGDVPAAGMTRITADGKGNFVGKTIFNRPDGKYGERVVVTFPVNGEYDVEPDGSGMLTIIPPKELGEPQTAHLTISQARVNNKGRKIATEATLILDGLLPNSGALQTAVLKRLPNRSKFDNSSFKGTYVSLGIGRGGQSSTASMTTIKADGKGNFVGKGVFNQPDGKFGERNVQTVPIAGIYHVELDGSGTITIFPPNEFSEPQTGHFMITQATRGNYKKMATAAELAVIADELLPNSGVLVTLKYKRLPQ